MFVNHHLYLYRYRTPDRVSNPVTLITNVTQKPRKGGRGKGHNMLKLHFLN
ncbi:hypothetical protein Barb4_00705 [Bacteroidales bacterium Barb4]|nr:hypothetical protein Barb4_00705 [Bacteroidales bacterium Barb4]